MKPEEIVLMVAVGVLTGVVTHMVIRYLEEIGWLGGSKTS